MTGDPESVLAFWFGLPGSATEITGRQRKLWFGKAPENDRAVAERFATALLAAAAGKLDHWANTPRGRLALVIVLDQFPHHIHRDQPQAFATDPQALAQCLAALAAAEDQQLAPIERVFLYLPLEHAESIDMQDQAVSLYEKLAREAGAANARCSTTSWITRAGIMTWWRASAAFRIATRSWGAPPPPTNSGF